MFTPQEKDFLLQLLAQISIKPMQQDAASIVSSVASIVLKLQTVDETEPANKS